MILQPESDLDSSHYTELAGLETGAVAQLTLQRLSIDTAVVDGVSSTNSILFDGDVSDLYVVRAVLSGTTITTEYWNGSSWTTADTITGASSTVAPAVSVSSSGTDVWVYFYKGGDVMYAKSTNSGVSFGAETSIVTVANVTFLAGQFDAVMIATYDTHNTKFTAYLASGTPVVSAYYLAGTISSMDLQYESRYSTTYLHVFVTRTAATRYETTRQGLFVFSTTGAVGSTGSEVSELIEIAVQDEYDSSNGFFAVKSGYIDGNFWVVFQEKRLGTNRMMYSVSSDGRYWEKPQYVGAGMWAPARIALLGDYVYYIAYSRLYRAPATGLVGNSTVEYDLSSAENYQFSRSPMHASSVTVNNDAGTYDTLVDTPYRYRLIEKVGYYSPTDGDTLVQTVATTEVDKFKIKTSAEGKLMTISARDSLGQLELNRATDYREITSPVRFYDDFADLGHVIGLKGTFRVSSNSLVANTTEGQMLALNSISPYIANCIYECQVKFTAGGSGTRYIGLVVRSNVSGTEALAAVYDLNSDTLAIRLCTGGTWSSILTSAPTLSWSAGTTYWLRVMITGNFMTLYYRTDGTARWTKAFERILVNDDNLEEGYIGYYGTDTQAMYFSKPLVVEAVQPLSLEGAIQACAEFGGIHTFDFDDYDLTFDTASGEGGNWSQASSTSLTCSPSAGSLSQIYWCPLSGDAPKAFSMTFKCGLGQAMGIFLGWEHGSGDRYYFYMDKNYEIGFGVEDSATHTETALSELENCGEEGTVTLNVERDYDGNYIFSAWINLSLRVIFYAGALGSSMTYKVYAGVFGDGSYGYGTGTWTYMRIPELYEDVPIVTIDVGEHAAQALGRVIGARHIKLFSRFDGSLRVYRMKASSSTRTLTTAQVDGYQEEFDHRKLVAHWRQWGARDVAEAYDTNLSEHIGDRFYKDDNPDLMYQTDCQEEADAAIARQLERVHTGSASYPFCPFQEPDDFITIGSDEWLITAYAVGIQAGGLICESKLREYTYG